VARFVERDGPDRLTAAEIVDQLGAYVSGRYQAAETHLVAEIARRAAADLDIDSQARRLAAIRELRAEAVRIMAGIDGEALARQVVDTAIAEGSAAAVEQIGLTAAARGVSTSALLGGNALPFNTGITVATATAAAQIGLELSNALGNVRERVIRAVPDTYQRIVAETAGERLLGTMTGRQLRRAALERSLDAGLTGFTDVAGRRWRMGSYTEMATRTATNRAWLAAHTTKWQSMGLNLVTIVRGVDSCQSCAFWSGKPLSVDGSIPAGPLVTDHATAGTPVTIVVAGSLADARAGGWNHPNCRCTLAPVFPGLSGPANDTTYDPQQEADRERLRYLERRTRDFKRREQIARASGDDVTAARWRRRALDEQKRIRDHVASTGQLRKPYREALSFADGAPRNLPPARPTAIVPDPPTVPGAGAAARADDLPEWLREHRAITARLPADRSTIGVSTRTLSADDARALEVTRLEGVYLGGQNAGDAAVRMDAMQDRIDAFKALRNARLDRGELTTATKWPDDLRDLAQRAGVARRQPRTVTLDALERAITEQGESRQLLEIALDRFDTAMAQRDARGWVARQVRADDLTPLGALGDDTARALDDVLAAGQIVDDEIQRRLAALPRPSNFDPQTFGQTAAQYVRLKNEHARLVASGQNTAARQIMPDLEQARARFLIARREREAFEAAVAAQRRTVTLDVLGEVRDYGGGARSKYLVSGGPAAELRDAMQRAHTHYPTAWNDYVAREFPEVELFANGRGFNSAGARIALSNRPGDGFLGVATHELGHSMENVPGVRGLEWAFHYRRSDKVTDASGVVRRADPVPLGAGYDAREVHVPDEWAENYVGKVYDRGAVGAESSWEVFTMGAESLFDGSPYLDYDPGEPDLDFRRWLLGVLSSV